MRGEQVVGERADGGEQGDRLQEQAEVPAGDLAARHARRRGREHAQRVHVERLRDEEPDDDGHGPA